jgi:hypothetical protein
MSEYPSLWRKIWMWGMAILFSLTAFVLIQDEGLTLISGLWLLAALFSLPPVYWLLQARLHNSGPKADA